MKPWWIIRYFESKTGYTKLDSSIIPFKLLPELEKLDVRKGHKFKTDQFEIEIPDANIKLHMPSTSLWVDNKPYQINGATRVILFNRNYHCSDGAKWKEVCIGLMTERGRGILVKYNMNTKKSITKLINGDIPDPQVVLYDQPKLPDIEN